MACIFLLSGSLMMHILSDNFVSECRSMNEIEFGKSLNILLKIFDVLSGCS